MAFVARTNLSTFDAGGHRCVFASSRGVAFVARTELPALDAGSHQKVFASGSRGTFVGGSGVVQQEVAVVPKSSVAQGEQADRQRVGKGQVRIVSTFSWCV